VRATPSPSPRLLPRPSDPKARLRPPQVEPAAASLPDSSLEWLVEARPVAGGRIRRTDLLQAFDPGWRRDHDLVRLYGWTGGAAHLVTGDSADGYDQVAATMRLLTASGDDDLRLVSAAHLTGFLDEATVRLRHAGAAEVTAPISAGDGAAHALALRKLFMAGGAEVQLRLFSPNGQPFDGPKLLDVLGSLGMPPDADGRVELAGFEVKTRTPPGRLDPLALLDGKLHPTSLIFEMYVPNVAHPVEVFDLMVKACDYAQKRLGGKREVQVELFGAARAADAKTARNQVAAVAVALAKGGFPAGAPSTLALFRMP
jgi:hypothetical protein